MQGRLVSVVLLLVATAAALSSGAVLSVRDYVPQGWAHVAPAHRGSLVQFGIFLTQRNADNCPTLLYEVSDPDSPKYGQHLTKDEILDLLAPPEEDQQRVIDWLVANGVGPTDITNFRDSLKVTAPVSVVEKLFSTELHVFRSKEIHGRKARTVIRQWGSAEVPDEIRPLIDVVTGIDDFPPLRRPSHARPVSADLVGSADAGYIIPDTLRNVYKIPKTVATNPESSVCLVEFQNDASFNDQDLAYFEQQTGEAPTNVSKAHIIGPYSPANPDAEATLDVQYASAIAAQTTVWYWTVTGWLLDFSQAFFNTETVPLTVSMSWGWTETANCAITNCNGLSNEQYVARVNTEWCKIGLRGVSLFAASGDQGAPGDGDYNCDDYSAPLSAIFPGASPYVTSVGATMLVDTSADDNVLAEGETKKRAQPPVCSVYQCASVTTEGVCSYPDALITTGGGFSSYSPVPTWQSKAVSAYLKSGVALPPAQYYNASNRGFPDISALGHNYLIYLAGQWTIVDGTSCSSPVWAAITALLNDARLNAGKKPLGFLAPLLYKLYAKTPSAFIPITSGDNKCTEGCCSTYGYLAGPAWSPVTGLGTPNFPAILAYVKALP